MIRLLFIVAFSLSVQPRAISEISVFFSPSKKLPEAIEQALDSATETIDLAIYSFSDTRTQTKIRDAAERGVTVRVILHNAKGESKTATKLEGYGADVRYVTKVMHHKFVIVDSARLLTGSSNWSRSAYSRYDEDLLRFVDEPELAAFQSEFDHIWNNAKEYGVKRFDDQRKPGNSGCENVYFTSANLEPYLYRGSPTFRTKVSLDDGVCGNRMIEAIEASKKGIKIATAHYRRHDLHDALLRAMKRGVQVEVLLDQQERHPDSTSTSNALYDEALALAGAEVRYKVYSRCWNFRTALQMHCKYMIVDERLVLTGSLNWSENAELKTFENLVVVTDFDVVAKYVDRFQMKWNYGKGKLNGVVAKLKGSKGRYPCSFPPMSLTYDEIESLYSLYADGACQ